MNSLSRLLSLRFWSRLTFRLCLASLSGVLNLFPRPSVDPFLVTRRPPPFEFRRLDSWKQLTIMQWQLEWKITDIKIQSGCLDGTYCIFEKPLWILWQNRVCDKNAHTPVLAWHLVYLYRYPNSLRSYFLIFVYDVYCVPSPPFITLSITWSHDFSKDNFRL